MAYVSGNTICFFSDVYGNQFPTGVGKAAACFDYTDFSNGIQTACKMPSEIADFFVSPSGAIDGIAGHRELELYDVFYMWAEEEALTFNNLDQTVIGYHLADIDESLVQPIFSGPLWKTAGVPAPLNVSQGTLSWLVLDKNKNQIAKNSQQFFMPSLYEGVNAFALEYKQLHLICTQAAIMMTITQPFVFNNYNPPQPPAVWDDPAQVSKYPVSLYNGDITPVEKIITGITAVVGISCELFTGEVIFNSPLTPAKNENGNYDFSVGNITPINQIGIFCLTGVSNVAYPLPDLSTGLYNRTPYSFEQQYGCINFSYGPYQQEFSIENSRHIIQEPMVEGGCYSNVQDYSESFSTNPYEPFLDYFPASLMTQLRGWFPPSPQNSLQIPFQQCFCDISTQVNYTEGTERQIFFDFLNWSPVLNGGALMPIPSSEQGEEKTNYIMQDAWAYSNYAFVMRAAYPPDATRIFKPTFSVQQYPGYVFYDARPTTNAVSIYLGLQSPQILQPPPLMVEPQLTTVNPYTQASILVAQFAGTFLTLPAGASEILTTQQAVSLTNGLPEVFPEAQSLFSPQNTEVFVNYQPPPPYPYEGYAIEQTINNFTVLPYECFFDAFARNTFLPGWIVEGGGFEENGQINYGIALYQSPPLRLRRTLAFGNLGNYRMNGKFSPQFAKLGLKK